MQCQEDLVVPLLHEVFGGVVSDWDLRYREVDALGGIDKLVKADNGKTCTIGCRSRTLSRYTSSRRDITLREESNGLPSELSHLGADFALYVVTDAVRIQDKATEIRWWEIIDLAKLKFWIDEHGPDGPGWERHRNGMSGELLVAIPLGWLDHELGAIVAESITHIPFIPGRPGYKFNTRVKRRILEFWGSHLRTLTLRDFGEG